MVPSKTWRRNLGLGQKEMLTDVFNFLREEFETRNFRKGYFTLFKKDYVQHPRETC